MDIPSFWCIICLCTTKKYCWEALLAAYPLSLLPLHMNDSVIRIWSHFSAMDMNHQKWLEGAKPSVFKKCLQFHEINMFNFMCDFLLLKNVLNSFYLGWFRMKFLRIDHCGIKRWSKLDIFPYSPNLIEELQILQKSEIITLNFDKIPFFFRRRPGW